MKILLLVWTICSTNPEYIQFKKEVHAEVLKEDASVNTVLNRNLYKAYGKKDAKTIVFLVALYHEWKCDMPEVAQKEIPDDLNAKSLDDLIRLVKEKSKWE